MTAWADYCGKPSRQGSNRNGVATPCVAPTTNGQVEKAVEEARTRLRWLTIDCSRWTGLDPKNDWKNEFYRPSNSWLAF